ncbi:U32 family peptidase [uncultured Clostridium sp.]|jgi:putative protease|uniref:U32 family peptidase n=1 Tax=uncultured Clostridium sp. TaxID=59620 RepID=UPI00261DB50E|nr:U32 family peptidase [uncultured Clostridium sp.]
MNKVELLAPAGSMESMIAAINKGADAIYLGGDKFSARAYATNFDKPMMEKAVDYAHSYGLPVYVTINTLIKQSEFNEAIDYIGFLYRTGVDAIIIQDTGILNRVREVYPGLEIHASTQMSVHNAEGAQFFTENGFQRIVLSRELSLKEIEYISKDLGIETEIFVHGALCVSYSGQCLLSSMIGERSGNRGKCAQACRTEYDLIRDTDGSKKSGHLLSPKDMCNIDNIDDLLKTGTSSLKVEGRKKKPEYVAGVIEAYREAIDEIEESGKRSRNREGDLLKLFNREGFSNAYLYKNTGKDMMAYNTPRNTGTIVGRIGKNSEIILEQDVTLKDGLRIGEGGFVLSKIIKDGNEVTSAKKGDKVVLYPRKYKQGDECYKMTDIILMNELKKSYEKMYQRKIALTAHVKFRIGMPFEMSLEYNGKTYKKLGENVEVAMNSPLDMIRVEKNIKKSGEIPFKIETVIFDAFDDGFMPMASINNLRRELLDEIIAYEIGKHKKDVRKERVEEVKTELGKKKYGPVIAKFTYKHQLQAGLDLGLDTVVIDIFGKNKDTLKRGIFNEVDFGNTAVYLEVPNIIKEEFDVVCRIIDSVGDKIEGLVTGNDGIIRRYKDKYKMIGGYKLNVFNAESLKFYNQYLEATPLSLEINRKEIKSIVEKEKEGAIFFVYGKPEVMISEYCPIGSTFGGKNTKRECNDACVDSTFRLRDRMSEDLVVMTDLFCRAHIYNTLPVNITSEMKDIKSIGVHTFRADFIDETYDETKAVLSAIIKGEPVKLGKFIKGHYRKGVE